MKKTKIMNPQWYNLFVSKSWIVVIASVLTVGCSKDSSDLNFLETDKNSGKDAPCAVSTYFPTATTPIRVSGSPSGKTTINLSPNNPDCAVDYYVNGNKLSVSGPAVEIPSSSLSAGSNTLEARVTGEKMSTSLATTHTWTLVKNSVPTCGTQTPAAAGNTTGIGGRFDMSAPLTDADGDTLSASWYINGDPAGTAVTSAITTNVLNAYIVTTSGQAGSMTLKSVVTDGYDTAECSWSLGVNQQCAFASYSPVPNVTTSEVRVPNVGSTQTQFVVVPNSGACTVSWALNGSPIGGSSNILPVLSSNLNSGTNTLRAILSDGSTTATKDWTIRKNTPPACAFQNPAASGVTYTLAASNLLTAMASDTESDPVTWSWTLNGSTPNAGVFVSASSGNTSLTTFNTLIGSVNTGSNTVTATINDGYDTSACTWALTINNACTIASTSPSGTTVKTAALATTSNTFSVSASDPGCPISWTLNGAPLIGTSATQVLQSSSLNPGGNTLVAATTNGSKTWFISKNIPPTCGTQSPGTSNNTLGVGLTTAFSITPQDNDDPAGPFTYSWKLNGLTVPAQVTTSVNTGATIGSASFTPISTQTGTNVLSVDIGDSYDTATCNWQTSVQPSCAVASSSPSTSTTKVSAIGSTSTAFVVSPNDVSCAVEWKINGGAVFATGGSSSILSSQLNTGDNTVTARLYNSTSSATRTWTVTKNVAPTCAGQSPSATGTVFGVSQSLNFLATAGNTDGDTLSFSWKVNGNTVAGAILSPTQPTATTSDGQFMPNASYVGANTIVAAISDGTDTANCTWSVTVRPDCAITSSIPSTATSKMSASSGASGTFGVVPNDSSCVVSWDLNGSNAGNNMQFLNVASPTLNSGSNTLTATISNGTSSVTRTWTVTKNRAPVCASQTPTPGTAITIDVGNNRDFTAIITDQDADTYTLGWLLNGVSAPSLFTNINSNAVTNTYQARFTPGVGQVGQGQFVGVSADDGYDTTICSWGMNVNDPNTVAIQACLPAGSPVVVTSAGTNSNRDFTVSATGTGLSYQWKLDGSNMAGQTSPALNVTAAGLAVGNHTLQALVTDSYSNQVSCTYNVKRNAPPVLSAPSPTITTLYRVNYANTIPMSITATDANGDMLSYTWKMDSGVNTNYLATGSSISTFDPKSDVNALGSHVLSVEVNDGNETTAYNWNVQVTTFSNQCNTVMNGNVTGAGATGGQICTLIGYPGVGHDIDPLTADPSWLRIRPFKVIEDELNNILISDDMSHVVWYYNKLTYAVTKFNQTIGAGKMKVILGSGASGNSNPSNISSGGTAGLAYKLYNPYSLAYDKIGKILYIADTSNHRVLSLPDSTDYPQLFLGGNGGTNDAARNVANDWGRNQVCYNPYDLAFYGTGVNRRLYVSCFSTNAVKVVNADVNDSSNYSRADIVVGRMPTATYNGVVYTGVATIGGFSNGANGRNGDAEILGPQAMTIDPLGRLYIWEQNGSAAYPANRGYNSFRVKIVNIGSTAFTALSSGSMSYIENIWADDITTAAPTSILAKSTATSTNATGTIQATSATLSASPTSTQHSMMISGPDSVRTNACIPYLITSRYGGLAGKVAAGVTVAVSTSLAGASLYSDSGCTAGAASVTFVTNDASKVIYQKATSAGSGTITATATGYAVGTYTVRAAVAGTSHNALRVTIPNTMQISDCVPFIVQAFNGSTPQTVTSNRTIRLFNDGSAGFYSDSACATAPIYRTTMTTGTGEVVLYTSRKINIQPGYTGVLLGNILTDWSSGGNKYGFNYYSNPTAGVPDAGLFLNWTDWGIEIDWDTVGSTLRGLFLSTFDYHRVEYLNLSGSTMSFGNNGITPVTVENGDVGVVINNSGTCGYVVGSNGVSSRNCNPRKLTVSNDRTKMYIADYTNGRVQSVDLSALATGGGAQALTTSGVVGTGYFRYLSGNFNDSSTPAVDARMNRPFRAVIDNETKRLYFTDQAYCRVRYVDLLGGMVQTIASRGCGDQTFDDDALYVYARDVKDLQIYTTGGAKWLLFSDNNNNGNDSLNTMSMIRAVNLGLTSATIYGQTIAGGRVGVIAGDFSRGTGAWNQTSNGIPLNSDGMSARAARLFNPDAFAIDSNTGTMYIALRSDNCIIKMTSAGVISQLINNCTISSPGSAVDGPARDGLNNPVANTRYPGKIVMDPAYPASGNFFYTDFLDSSIARIRYANFLTSAVPFGNVTATAGTSSNPSITTIFTIPTAGMAGYSYGLAAFDRQICVSSGYFNGDGANYPHNILCKDRYNSNFSTNTSLVVGPDPTVSYVRGGGPLGLEQEGIAAGNAVMNGPTDIEFDADGNLYIIEAGNHLIRFVRRWW